MPSQNTALLRSALFMPANNTRALEKIAQLDADVFVIDLEDSVAPSEKDQARSTLVEWLNSCKHAAEKQLWVRTNQINSEWIQNDISALANCAIDGLVIPKVDHADDITDLETLMSQEHCTVDVWPMLESATSILQCFNICQASQHIAGLIMGTNDLAKSLELPDDHDRLGLQHSLSQAVLVAKAHQLPILDGVCSEFSDLDLLECQSKQARRLGFNGKTLIHPNQIEAANRIFGPSEAEIERAKALVAFWSTLPENKQGAVRFNDSMIEELHVKQARRLLSFIESE